MKYITIQFSRREGITGRLLRLAGEEYSHCSLILEDEPQRSWSLGRKGIITESAKDCDECIRVRIAISESVNDHLEAVIMKLEGDRQKYRSSALAAISTFLHLPFHLNRNSSSAQFIARILKMSGAVRLDSSVECYHPRRLLSELYAYPAMTGFAMERA